MSIINKWNGEEQFARMFRIRGFKVLCVMLKEEINKVRVKAGLPEYTWQQILDRADVLMDQYETDDSIENV